MAQRIGKINTTITRAVRVVNNKMSLYYYLEAQGYVECSALTGDGVRGKISKYHSESP